MLPNHAPLVVAEQFALLEAAYPGRIDLGIGRAPGTDPVTRYALRHGAGGVDDDAVARFPAFVDDVHRDDGRRRRRPRRRRPHPRAARHPAAASRPSGLAAGVLRLLRPAGRRQGLPYVFAHHFSGSGTAEALELYRSGFRPSPELAEPRTFLTVNVVGGRDRRGGRPAGPPAAARDGRAAHREASCARSCWSRRPRRSRSAGARPRCCDAMRRRWVIGTPDEAAAEIARARRDVRRGRGDGAPRRRRVRRRPGRRGAVPRGHPGAAGRLPAPPWAPERTRGAGPASRPAD